MFNFGTPLGRELHFGTKTGLLVSAFWYRNVCPGELGVARNMISGGKTPQKLLKHAIWDQVGCGGGDNSLYMLLKIANSHQDV